MRAIRLAPHQSALALSVLILAVSASVHAQVPGGGGQPPVKLTPKLSVDALYSDNINPTGLVKSGDLAIGVSPGLQLDARGGRSTGRLGLGLKRYTYAKNASLNTQQRSLDASGQMEIIDKQLFLDASARVAAGSVSAFGQQTGSTAVASPNRSETTTWQISPRFLGTFVGVVDYELRFSSANAKADGGTLAAGSGTSTTSWSAKIGGNSPLSMIGWNLNLLEQRSEQGVLGTRKSGRASANLEFRIDPQYRATLGLEKESGDVITNQQTNRSGATYGLEWSPTERTKLLFKREQRTFGAVNRFDFSHRTALSAWKFSDTKDVVLPSDQLAQFATSPAAQLLDAQLLATIPDPIERAAEVERLLHLAGIPISGQPTTGILSARAFVRRSKQASFSLTGVNNTVTFALQRSVSETGTGAVVADDFTGNGAITQSGLTASWAHKLSPDSTLNLSLNRSKSSGSLGAATDLETWILQWNSKFGHRTSGSLGLRQTSSANQNNPAGLSYNEHALTGSLLFSF